MDMVFAGDVPMAAGLSSSAAVEVATALALDSLHGTGASMQELAMIAHRAETGYVGLQCGVMDQFASALGKHGHALLLDCHKLAYTHVPIDQGSFEILVMDTKVPRTLGETRFNERVAECSEAHRILRQVRDLPCLAAYEPTDLEAAGDRLNGALRRRATHVIEETRRVADAVDALRSDDIAAVGRALNESHHSTRDNYEVSSLELDVITDAARELSSVYGARLTGAGFGGCAIALIQPGAETEVTKHVRRRFCEHIGWTPDFRLLRVGSGATELRLATP
jgi:galactokinase